MWVIIFSRVTLVALREPSVDGWIRHRARKRMASRSDTLAYVDVLSIKKIELRPLHPSRACFERWSECLRADGRNSVEFFRIYPNNQPNPNFRAAERPAMLCTKKMKTASEAQIATSASSWKASIGAGRCEIGILTRPQTSFASWQRS